MTKSISIAWHLGTTLGLLAMFALLAPPGHAQQVSKIETFGAWTLLADGASPHSLCFITSEPTQKDPDSATREAPRLYVSSWPKEGIKAEVSVRMGFPVKASAGASARVGDAPFVLIGAQDRLFVKDATAELKLIDAMKKGADLKAEATSERGTKVTDTYALQGLSQALARMQDVCR